MPTFIIAECVLIYRIQIQAMLLLVGHQKNLQQQFFSYTSRVEGVDSWVSKLHRLYRRRKIYFFTRDGRCTSLIRVSGLVMTIAIVAIVYAIIDCLKKTGTAIPTYARIATNPEIDKSFKQDSSSSADHVAISIPMPPAFPVVPDSQVEHATMERFLSNMAREKPIRFSPQQLSGFTNNYATILGSGAFGVVFKGEFPNGIQVAVKALTNHSNKQVEEQFMAEVGSIGRTYHINLVRLYGFCFDSSTVALVYEFMENGSLDRFLFDKNQDIEWKKLHDIAVGTAKGLAYLHEECQEIIIHYDIKPGNILVDSNLHPKVADFGLAKLCNREINQITMTGLRGTPGYAAPELWKPYPVTHKCDIYSFGMVLFEIVGRRRNHNLNLSESQQWLPRWTWDMFINNELAVLLSLHGIEEKDREKAERMAKVALWCVQYSPEARPLMSTVVKMLEGGMEIPQPPNPFEHLEPNLAFYLGSDEDYSTSASRTNPSTAGMKTRRNHFEIELASR